MTDECRTDRDLQIECESLAQDIFDEMRGETPEDTRDDMMDRAHEAADGHMWVIYHYHAHKVCANCNTDQGEQFLEDVGPPETPTYDNLATVIVYGEMFARIQQHIETLIDDWELAEENAG